VKALKAKGVDAAAIVADAGNPSSVREAIVSAQKTLGPIHIVQWTAYAGGAGDMTKASLDELSHLFDVPVLGLVAAVQAALPDLKANKGGVLVTNGGFGLLDANMDQVAANIGAMGLAVSNAAKHKLVRVLAAKLKPDHVYVGEAMVCGMVKGTAFDNGSATIEPSKVAGTFWKLWSDRSELSINVT
jgi:NADP-dependent 3-hydroxy acid dehydrogenase YdfG